MTYSGSLCKACCFIAFKIILLVILPAIYASWCTYVVNTVVLCPFPRVTFSCTCRLYQPQCWCPSTWKKVWQSMRQPPSSSLPSIFVGCRLEAARRSGNVRVYLEDKDASCTAVIQLHRLLCWPGEYSRTRLVVSRTDIVMGSLEVESRIEDTISFNHRSSREDRSNLG
jgi:hypothetical protein